MNSIICIAGPTASGKTALAVELAKSYNAEVISCDSMQIYRYMDIGTAKPTKEEMQGIVHHMLDVAHPAEEFSVSRYCAMATPIIEDILSRGKNVIVAGGTGLYMDALIRGNDFAPYPATGCREELEAQAECNGIESILKRLAQVDPDSAARLHPGDRKRIIRAMEVFLETGITITEHNRRTQLQPPRFKATWFGLEDAQRQDLYARIDQRVETMIQAGLMDEIKQLLELGIPEKCTAMQAIGYKEFLGVLNGSVTLSDAVANVQQASRHYAKRQLTWFRKNTGMHWLRREKNETTLKILEKARQYLSDSDT